MLRSKFGWEGYGLYWAILENMAENNGVVNRGAIGGLSVGLGIKATKLTDFLNFSIEIKLFSENSKKDIFSERLISQIEFRKTLSDAGKAGSDKRWANRGANGGAISTPNAKERKGKERKYNISKDENSKLEHASFPSELKEKEPDIIIGATAEELTKAETELMEFLNRNQAYWEKAVLMPERIALPVFEKAKMFWCTKMSTVKFEGEKHKIFSFAGFLRSYAKESRKESNHKIPNGLTL